MGIADTGQGLIFGDTAASSAFTNIMQDLFLPVVAEAVTYPNVLLKMLPRSTHNVEGKLIKFPIHYDDASGAVAIGEEGDLPDVDTEKWAQYAYGVRHMYVRTKFTGIMADAANSTKAAWIPAVMNEIEAKMKIMARQRQRIYHNDGSGRLAEVVSPTGAAYANVQYVVRINQGIESPSTCTSAPTRFLKAGMKVAFVTSAGTIQACATVASIDSTTQITLSGVVQVNGGNVAAGDWIVTAATLKTTLLTRDTGFKNEMMGIAGILSDADPNDGTVGGFQGIDSDSATNAWLRATILGNSGVLRPVTPAVMDLAWTTAIEVGDNTPTAILATFGMTRAVAQGFLDNRRFVNTRRFDGGYDAIEYNGVPIVSDKDMYANRLAYMDLTDLEMNVLADPYWINRDGSIYSRIENKDAFQAALCLRENLSSKMRKRHVLQTDLQEA